MTPEEYIRFKKLDFIDNCIASNFSENNANDFFTETYEFIEKFRIVRHSESHTELISNELVAKCEHQFYRNGIWESNKYSFITFWVTKAIWIDRSFYWAKVKLAMYQNRKSGMDIFDFSNKPIISVPELFELLKAEENTEESLIDSRNHSKSNDYEDLLKALSKYISGINVVEFTNIIEHHSLTLGAHKAIWQGIPADAHRFATIIGMKLPKFNECFSLANGRKLRHNDKNDTWAPIKDILEKYLNK